MITARLFPPISESIRLNPSDAWAHFELARAALMSLDIDKARQALADFIRISRSSLLLKGQSLSPSQNHVGQLLDEFVLDADALAELRSIFSGSSEVRFLRLRTMLARYPDYTPAAILLAIALRRNRQFEPLPVSDPKGQSPIPRHIVQFWDQDPPEDVSELMASWRDLNPSYRWTCFNNDSARDFLKLEFGLQILRAYDRAVVPAQQADLFRLAWLAARGGIYADADDRCLAPIDSLSSSRGDAGRPSRKLRLHRQQLHCCYPGASCHRSCPRDGSNGYEPGRYRFDLAFNRPRSADTSICSGVGKRTSRWPSPTNPSTRSRPSSTSDRHPLPCSIQID